MGIDLSKAQVENAQKQCQENIQNIVFNAGNATNLPVESDAVTCAQAWHWLNPADLYHECNIVLNPRVVLLCMDTSVLSFTNKDFNHLVSNF